MSVLSDSSQIMYEILTAGASAWAVAIEDRIRTKLKRGFENDETFLTMVQSGPVPVGESDSWDDTWTMTFYGGTDNGKDPYILFRKFVQRFSEVRGEKVTTGKIITGKILSVDRTPDPVKGWPRVVAVVETTMTLP